MSQKHSDKSRSVLLCLKRGEKFSVNNTSQKEDYYIAELVIFLHKERGYPLDWIHIKEWYRTGSNEGRGRVEADVLVIDPDSAEEKRAYITCEVKVDETPKNREETISRQLFSNMLLSKAELGIYWSSTEKFFFVGAEVPVLKGKKSKSTVAHKRLSYDNIPYCPLFADERVAGLKNKRLERKDLLPLGVRDNICRRMEFAGRNHGGSVSAEQLGGYVFSIILAKYFDEIKNHRKNSEMRFQFGGDSKAQVAKNIKKLCDDATKHFKRQSIAMEKSPSINNLSDEYIAEMVNVLQNYCLQNSDRLVIQEIYTKFAPSMMRSDLAQYYTPQSPVNFIAKAIDVRPETFFIDPACGTADFVSGIIKHQADKLGQSDSLQRIKQSAHAWDISDTACRLAGVNMILHGDGLSQIKERDSIKENEEMNGQFSFVVTNPPFGTGTLEKRDVVLRNYKLAKLESGGFRKSVETGLLFVERSMNLLDKDGICCIILPDSYLTVQRYNFFRDWLFDNHRVLGVVKLPDTTFELTGAVVKSSIVLIQKGIKDEHENYEIFVFSANHIGFKKHKNQAKDLELYDPDGGVVMDGERAVVIDDLLLCSKQLAYFAGKNEISGLVQSDKEVPYQRITRNDVLGVVGAARKCIFVKRADASYLAALKRSSKNSRKMSECCDIKRGKYPKENEILTDKAGRTRYVTTGGAEYGSYTITSMSRRYLPDRARKFKMKSGDILVATQNGWRNFAIVKSEKESAFFSSGFIHIRPKDEQSKWDIISFFLSPDWKIISLGLAVGIGQEDFKEDDFMAISVPHAKKSDVAEAKKAVSNMQRMEEVYELDEINSAFYNSYQEYLRSD